MEKYLEDACLDLIVRKHVYNCSHIFKAGLVFVDLLRRPGIDSQPGGPVRNPICRTGPPGYIGWRNRFLGIDSWAP